MTRQPKPSITAFQALEEQYKLLLSLMQAIASAGDLESALNVSLRLICEKTNWSVGDAWALGPTGERLYKVASYSWDPARYHAFLDSSRHLSLARDESLPGRVVQHGEVVRLDNISQSSEFARMAEAAANGLYSAIAFPIKAQQEIVAVICFYVEEQVENIDHFISLVSAVSEQLGMLVKQKRAEDSLRESELRFRAVSESCPDCIVLIDEESRILYANAATYRIFAYPLTESLNGQPITMLMPEGYRSQHLQGIAKYLQTGIPQVIGHTVEMSGLRKDGSEFPISLSVGTWTMGENHFFGGVIRDITERKMAEQALIKKNEELRQSNSDLENFAYIASHDMKEPLRMISNYVQLIAQRYGPLFDHNAKTYFSFVVGGVHRMQAQIDDLLTYSRIGRYNEEYIPVDINAVLDTVMHSLAEEIEASGAHIDRGYLPTIQANPTQMYNLFANLLGNAIKFRGTEKPEIRIRATNKGKDWLFSIQDNGIGIAPMHQDKIFLIFQRLNSREEYPGTGIGLAICRRIVELHGGRLWVESEENKGSTFFFSIPKKPAK